MPPNDVSHRTFPAVLEQRQIMVKEEQARRTFYGSRHPDWGAGAQDPCDEHPLSFLKRTMVTQQTLADEARSRTPTADRIEHREKILSLTRGEDYFARRGSPATAPCSPMQAAVSSPSRTAPATGLSRRSASVPSMYEQAVEQVLASGGAPLTPAVSSTGSLLGSRVGGSRMAASSRRSRFSRMSGASVRSFVSEAVEREVARSALGDYKASAEAAKQRHRAKALAMPIHLRTGPNPIDMGQKRNLITEAQDAATRPVQMAVDPKWSTEIKKMNDRAGDRIKYEAHIAGAIPGSLIPELRYSLPKKHLSNPPTPFFKPGVQQRSSSSSNYLPERVAA